MSDFFKKLAEENHMCDDCMKNFLDEAGKDLNLEEDEEEKPTVEISKGVYEVNEISSCSLCGRKTSNLYGVDKYCERCWGDFQDYLNTEKSNNISDESHIGHKFTVSKPNLGLEVGDYEVVDEQNTHSGLFGSFSNITVKNVETGEETSVPLGNAQAVGLLPLSEAEIKTKDGFMGNIWACPECGFKTVSEDEYTDHMHAHESYAKENLYKCPSCNDLIDTDKGIDNFYENMLDHLWTKHGIESDVAYNIIDKQFGTIFTNDNFFWVGGQLKANKNIDEESYANEEVSNWEISNRFDEPFCACDHSWEDHDEDSPFKCLVCPCQEFRDARDSNDLFESYAKEGQYERDAGIDEEMLKEAEFLINNYKENRDWNRVKKFWPNTLAGEIGLDIAFPDSTEFQQARIIAELKSRKPQLFESYAEGQQCQWCGFTAKNGEEYMNHLESKHPQLLTESNVKSAENNVYWKDVSGEIIDKGSHFEDEGGNTIWWNGSDAAVAQQYLSQRANGEEVDDREKCGICYSDIKPSEQAEHEDLYGHKFIKYDGTLDWGSGKYKKNGEATEEKGLWDDIEKEEGKLDQKARLNWIDNRIKQLMSQSREFSPDLQGKKVRITGGKKPEYIGQTATITSVGIFDDGVSVNIGGNNYYLLNKGEYELIGESYGNESEDWDQYIGKSGYAKMKAQVDDLSDSNKKNDEESINEYFTEEQISKPNNDEELLSRFK